LPKTTSDEKLEKSPKAMNLLLVIGVVFLPVLFSDWAQEVTGMKKSIIIALSLVIILLLLFAAMIMAKKNPAGMGCDGLSATCSGNDRHFHLCRG